MTATILTRSARRWSKRLGWGFLLALLLLAMLDLPGLMLAPMLNA